MADGNGTGVATDGGSTPLGPDSEGAKPVRLGPNLTGSPDWHELIGDLKKARAEMPSLIKDHTAVVTSKRTGQTHKYTYADLADVLELCLGPLRTYGLAVIQAPDFDGTKMILTTVIANEAGAWLSNTFRVPCDRVDTQGVGAAVTYARRYALTALLAICGEDDDGAAAMPQKEQPRQTANKATGNKMTSGKDLESNPAKLKIQQLIKNEIKCPRESGPALFEAVTAGKFKPDATKDPKAATEILAMFEAAAKRIPYGEWLNRLDELQTSQELDDFAAAALP